MTTNDFIDEDARRRITADGLDQLLFVEAGAGTGKTKQLVDRVIALVLDRAIPMREIAAVTFTEAAAAELRTRIREAFERLVDDDATPDHRRDQAETALAELDSAAIGTVHSFAQRLLSEHPIEAGLPPHVEVLDEVESLLAFGDRWEDHVDEMFADHDLDDVLICARLLGVRVDHPRQPSLRNVAGTFGDNWDRLDDVAAIAVEVPTVDRAAATAAMAELAALLDRCRQFPDDKLAERLLGFEPEMVVVRRALVEGTDRSVWRALAARHASTAKAWSHKTAGSAATWGGREEKAAAGAVVADAEAALAAMYRDAGDAVLRVLAGSVARFTLDAAVARRREGRLEFHDLLVLARRLLRTSAVARTALHGRYTRLLVDEFQDTDPIQIELAVLLAASVGGGELPERWQDVVVDDARLFFVGDAKQSIYRFRRADIGLFLAARDRFVDESVRLTTNFRTVPPVIDWVNAVFGRVMDEEVPGRRPRYEPLVAHRAGSGGDHRVVLLGGPHTAEEKKEQKITAARLRELEAGAVADAIAGVLADPSSWPVHDKATRTWRDARAEDITILLPTRTSLGALMDALRSRRIEFRAETGVLVYDTQEVRDLLAVLRTVAHPGDAVALVASLRSPIFACGDDDLLSYVAAGGRWDGGGRPQDLDPGHPVVAALDYLEELRAARWWTGPSALLERVIRDRRAMTLAFGAPRARDVWRRLRFLVDQARLFEASQSADLVEFVAWTELQRSDMARVHEPLLPESDDRAVRIMTMHGAKGLEFPITVLSGLTTKLTGRRSGFQVYWEDDGTVVLRAKADLASVGFDRRADLEAEMDDEEKHRLLYVACTRARDHLLVATHHFEGTPCFAAIAWDHSQNAGQDLWRVGEPGPTLAVVRPPVGPSGITDEAAWAAARRTLLATAGRRTVVSATAVKREGAAAAAAEVDPITELVDAQEDSGDTVPAWRHGRGATAFGRAVHSVLEDVDLATGADVDVLASAAAVSEGVPALVGEIAAASRAVLGAPIMREAAGASVAREMYVAAPIGDRVVEGYIDLLVRTDEGLVIVDYKTDHVEDDAAIDARADDYALQLATYAAAVEVATGERVRAGVLVFGAVPGAPGAVERRFPRDRLDTDRVAELVRAPG